MVIIQTGKGMRPMFASYSGLIYSWPDIWSPPDTSLQWSSGLLSPGRQNATQESLWQLFERKQNKV